MCQTVLECQIWVITYLEAVNVDVEEHIDERNKAISMIPHIQQMEEVNKQERF